MKRRLAVYETEMDIRQVSHEELKVLSELEAESYPPDEAASYETSLYRWKEAPDLTLAGFRGEEMVGFVCGTRYHGDRLTDESMKMHIPNGKSVCIHSVVVKPTYRRQGIALQLLKRYVQTIQREQRDATQILLISKSKIIPLYTRAGFILRGKSEVFHGKDTWYELAMPIPDPSNS